MLNHISEHRNHNDHDNMSANGDNFDPKKKSKPVAQKVKDLEGKITNIFHLDRPEEAKRFNKKVGNEHMLFHASRFSNWVGILSRGILLPDAVTKLGIPRTDFGKPFVCIYIFQIYFVI